MFADQFRLLRVLGARTWLSAVGLGALLLGANLACNYLRLVAPYSDEQEQGQSDAPPAQEAANPLPGKAPPSSLLPSDGRWIVECEDPGIVAWDQQACNVAWGHEIDVLVDFETRKFSLTQHDFCESTFAGLFAERHSRDTHDLSLVGGEVRDDGRLFGRAVPTAGTAIWIEGEGPQDPEPEPADELMVVGFVNTNPRFIAFGMCLEENIVGGAEAILASGWRQDLNPCGGSAEWPIVCRVVHTEETLK